MLTYKYGGRGCLAMPPWVRDMQQKGMEVISYIEFVKYGHTNTEVVDIWWCILEFVTCWVRDFLSSTCSKRVQKGRSKWREREGGCSSCLFYRALLQKRPIILRSLLMVDAARVGRLRLVGSLKLEVSFAEYCVFYRALLQKRPMILRSLLLVAVGGWGSYGVATLSRLLKMIGLFCKRVM